MDPKPTKLPPQEQSDQPGHEHQMEPQPQFDDPTYLGSSKLQDKIAIITGGDSGIGRAVAVAFAKEGADICIIYYDEHADAQTTQQHVQQYHRKCILIKGDLSQSEFCHKAVEQCLAQLGKPNILVNNAAIQFPTEDVLKITQDQLHKTFATNIFSYFYMSQAVLPHFKKNDVIINTTSVTAYRGSKHLIDYSSTKGAIVAFTRSLSQNLASQSIRVNAVAPGPIWTPLIPATFDSKHVSEFGTDTPLGRPGQPSEIAPSFVFLASADSSYMTGQVLHPNGGEIING